MTPQPHPQRCETCDNWQFHRLNECEVDAAIIASAIEEATPKIRADVLDKIPVSELHWCIGRISYVIDHNRCMKPELEEALVRITTLAKLIESLRSAAPEGGKKEEAQQEGRK